MTYISMTYISIYVHLNVSDGQLILRSVKRVFHYLRILLHLRIKFAVGRSVCGLHWPFTVCIHSSHTV